MSPLDLVPCSLAQHGPAILQILNHEIRTSTSLYDLEPRSPASMVEWFAVRQVHDCPVLGLQDASGTLYGFASYAPFRPHGAYRHTMEHSVYVHPGHRGAGLGQQLLQALVRQATARQVHTLIGVIDTTNVASVALHRRLGFQHAGTLTEVGFKFNRWLDVHLYHKRLGDVPDHDPG